MQLFCAINFYMHQKHVVCIEMYTRRCGNRMMLTFVMKLNISVSANDDAQFSSM